LATHQTQQAIGKKTIARMRSRLVAFGTKEIAARREPVHSAHKSKSDTLSGDGANRQSNGLLDEVTIDLVPADYARWISSVGLLKEFTLWTKNGCNTMKTCLGNVSSGFD
jgi:hypothetical protein